jgi:mannose-6-phosphate isomerase-like protein (cupin superfamily)
MVRKIMKDSITLAVIIDATYNKEGVEFFTPGNYSQQLGYMQHGKGYSIPPHTHNIIPREVELTQEVLYIKKGKVRVDFYDNEQTYLESTIVQTGDVILLAAGGHGFEMLEKTEMIEIKQGPYLEEEDKIRFKPIDPKKVVYK